MDSPPTPQKKFWQQRRRWLLLAGGMAAVGAIAGWVGLQTLRPGITEGWQDIYQGVELQVRPIPAEFGSGRMMAVRVRWDHPGVKLKQRPPDIPFLDDPRRTIAPRAFRLTVADWALWRQNPAIFVNTTRYYNPHEAWRSLPGVAVAPLETLVVDHNISHAHPHSYLLWWDDAGNAALETTKPPTPEILEKAQLAIGVQGVAIAAGQINVDSLNQYPQPIPRTFIGIDNTQKYLYLLAFEDISEAGMAQMALALGVQDGAMVDSGDATHLLIGTGAKNLTPHTGIRHRRPLAGYLMIFADPLDPEQNAEKPESAPNETHSIP